MKHNTKKARVNRLTGSGPPPLGQALKHHEEHGDEHDRDDRCTELPAEDDRAERLATRGTGAARHDEWKNAQHEGEGRHEDGTETEACRVSHLPFLALQFHCGIDILSANRDHTIF